MALNILIAGRLQMFGDMLSRMLECEADINVIGRTEDGREALALCTSLRPDVAVIDADLNGMESTDTIHQIREREHPPAVVCVSLRDDTGESHEIMMAGASEYIGKDRTPEQLVAAIHRAASRGAFHVQTTGTQHNRVTADGHATGHDAEPLTMREREILKLLAEGHVGKEIADLLNISVKTVSTHRVHIGDKLGTRNTATLTRYALRNGLTTA